MLDSLLGGVILLMLTSWMVSVMAIQSRLLASSGQLTSRDQLDYLRSAKQNYTNNPVAYAASSAAPVDPCAANAASGRFLDHLKSLQSSTPQADHLNDLRTLLIAPQVMARAEGLRPRDIERELQADGRLPFTTADGQLDLTGFLTASNPREAGNLNRPTRESPDWTLTLEQNDPLTGEKARLPLWICNPS